MPAKFIIFDVGNASCGLAVCSNGYSMMIDCGSHGEKDCPADLIRQSYNDWLGLTPYVREGGNEHLLTLLHITHPDEDHVRNSKKIKETLPPYLLHRRKHEVFPDTEEIDDDYKNHLDLKYRGNPVTFDDWGFDKNLVFKIPMQEIKKDEELFKKIKNNSSILRFIEYGGVKILFGGDLETSGWEWLAKNDDEFIRVMKGGIDILITPHHGHKSGFPKALFDLTGNVKVSVLSKASEANKDGTDVSSQYLEYADGITYKNLGDDSYYSCSGTLTTRSNGHIFFNVNEDGSIDSFAQKASSNHSKI